MAIPDHGADSGNMIQVADTFSYGKTGFGFGLNANFEYRPFKNSIYSFTGKVNPAIVTWALFNKCEPWLLKYMIIEAGLRISLDKMYENSVQRHSK